MGREEKRFIARYDETWSREHHKDQCNLRAKRLQAQFTPCKSDLNAHTAEARLHVSRMAAMCALRSDLHGSLSERKVSPRITNRVRRIETSQNTLSIF